MKRRAWAVLLPLAVVVLFPAFAEVRGQPDRKKGFEKKDFGKQGPPFGGLGGPGGSVRKVLDRFDKDGDGRLNAEERKAAREVLKKEGGGKGGFRPGGPGGFGGPGAGLTKPLMEGIDSDGDGKLTRAELVAGVKKLYQRADKESKGAVTEAQLAAALTAIIPAQRGFGGPGGFGGMFGPPPQPGQVLPEPVQDRLELTGKQKKAVQALQKEVDTKLAKILTEAQRKSLAQMRERPGGFGPPGFGPGGPGPGGPGGFRPGGFGPGGGPSQGAVIADAIARRADAKKDGKVTLARLLAAAEVLFDELDKNDDGKLDEAEVAVGITLLSPNGPFGGREPARPGPKVKPDEVKAYPKAEAFDPGVLRTVFLEFESKKDWEAELADFKGTDVEVPATVTVDGKKYTGVGVHFRGMSSYGMVGAGSKRSLNLSFDFVDKKQRFHGEKTLNLLNSADDPSYLRTVLYSHIARKHIAAPKANLVKVVINGESWGVYVSAQQFNKDFLKQNFKTDKGTRWKVPGSPGGRGGLEYLGDDVASYKSIFSMKGKDDAKAWKALINLCQVLNETPADKLEAALRPILDLDGALWFLALDVALINNDGYWTRASDYGLYLDPKGKFHIVPHDMNEAFSPAMSFGFGPGGPGGPFGGPGGGFGGPGSPSSGVDLDPLTGLTDSRKPLRSKLLAVPALKERYLRFVRTIAEDHLDWKVLGPVVAKSRALVEKEVEADTRKLYSLAAFQAATGDKAEAEGASPRREMSLRSFADKRRAFLLAHEEVKKVKKVSGPKERE